MTRTIVTVAALVAALASPASTGADATEKACAEAADKAACRAVCKQTLAYLATNFRPGADPKTAPKLPDVYDVKCTDNVDEMRFLIMARITQGLRAP